MVVVRYFVAAIAGDDIKVTMSFRPDLARTEQGTFKLVSMATKLSIDLQNPHCVSQNLVMVESQFW